MGGRLSFLRRKRAKQAATVPDAVPTVVEAPPPPPPEVFDSTTFWEALKGILRFRLPQGSDLVPIDKSTLHIHDATKLSDDELDDVKEVSKALGDRLTTSNALLSTTKKEDAAMELFTYALSLLALGNTTDVEKEWENVFHMARCEWALGRFDKSIALLDTLQLDANDAMDPSMSNKRLVLADAQALFMRPHGGADVAAS
ncbi:hypothetical protein DYB25_004133 [Aphanomyces astaci]|uniref:Uncharacterized protein n=1 Tax=Aphanomyces astaci TaxID=112090 RepID=A0A396ZRB6_APHAT|nr:hypothetical protein DYB25_004133 [Aphanomyces astaci]RHY60353.1 hypothetical protein DYB34_003388 [Aphanomyces astaci]RHY81655.1 hypothetical protein DYB31_002899 [Aphanomyces astaci]RHZ16563.1 hypothetical protein DYB26_000251 [Aphanomyces astaci]